MTVSAINEGQFWEQLYRKARNKRIPVDTTIELTCKCNLFCRHCYIVENTEKNELSFDEIRVIIDQLYETGCLTIAFTGGEIFTRDDCLEILLYTNKKGFFIEVMTNATLIDNRLAKSLSALRRINAHVSLYGITGNVYKTVTGADMLERCLAGAKLLAGSGIQVKINMLVTKDNIHQIDDVGRFAESIKADFQADPYINPASDGNKIPIKKRVKPEKYIQSTTFICNHGKRLSTCKEYYPDINTDRQNKDNDAFFPCDAGKNSMVINPYGMAYICLNLPYPKFDVRQKGLLSAWNKIVSYRESIKSDKWYECKGCNLRNYCDRCPGNSFLETGAMNQCIPYLKEIATLKRNAND